MNVTKLPEYLRKMRRDIDELFKLFRELNHKVVVVGEDYANHQKDVEELQAKVKEILTRNAELEHMVRLVKTQKTTGVKNTGVAKTAELFADNHDLDAFYLEFENYFRGSEKDIQEKQKPYVALFEKSGLGKKHPVVDLGCGRGEFLELLEKSKLKTIGVDMNESMVERAKEKGFEAVNDEAINYLMRTKSESLAGVTGFHLAEHIPFESLLALMAEAHRCLVKGGILLLETPNPESLFVGAFTFHYDPSHLKPLPPAIVQFSAKFKGFERADIMRVQPELTEKQIKEATKNQTLQGALQRLYGPRDYALVAYK